MKRFWTLSVSTAFMAMVAFSQPVMAQSSVSSEIQRMQRDITELQRQIFQNAGQASSGGAVTAPSGGVALPTDVAGRLQVQLQRMEEDLRRLTGRAEEMEFQNRQLSQRLDKLSTDIDIRFRALEGGNAVLGQGGNGLNTATGQAFVQNTNVTNPFPTTTIGDGNAQGVSSTVIIDSQGASSEVRSDSLPNLPVAEGGELAEGQQLFGQLTQTQLENNSNLPPETSSNAVAVVNDAQTAIAAPTPNAAPVNSAGQIVASAPSTPAVAQGATGLYKHAFGFLKKRDFASAETALNEFLETYPEDALAGNAMYWLGEAHYARARFGDAADVFVKAYTQYPASSKASHSLLKLGMSLNQLGERDAACQVFVELDSKFPDAEERVVKLGKSESKKLGC